MTQAEELAKPALTVAGPADYSYIKPNAIVKTDRSGDTYMEWSFDVIYKGTKLGTTTIWHNRFGAFANFTETRSYPLP